MILWSWLVYSNLYWICLYNLEVAAYWWIVFSLSLHLNQWLLLVLTRLSKSIIDFVQRTELQFRAFQDDNGFYGSSISCDHCAEISRSCVWFLQGMDRTRCANDRRHGEQQTKQDLVANGMDIALPRQCCLLPYLGTTRTRPFPTAFPTHAHRGDPSK
jgi:hypothetical protein